VSRPAGEGASQAQVALAWLMAQPGISAPIASATSAARMTALMGAMRLGLEAEQLSLIGAVSAHDKIRHRS